MSEHNAEAVSPESVPDEWVRAAEDHYSMHGTGLIRNIIAGVAPLIAAAERERLYAELGNDHYVIFTRDGWTTEHSVECRLSGRMSECEWHEAVRRFAGEFDPDLLGRWRITGVSEGRPGLERAEREADGG